MRRSLPAAAAFVLVFAAASRAEEPRRLLAAGWDSPTPAEFRAHAAEFARLPFDGTVIKATRSGDGGEEIGSSYAFGGEAWEPGSFASAEADLRAAGPAGRESFLAVYANPGGVDWFDDAGWAAVAEHWRLLARAAKRGGLRGLMFDPEPYEKPWAQFHYGSQPGRRSHSFAEYHAMARRRGREVMAAAGEEFPDATVFCWRLVSDLLEVPRSRNPEARLARETFGLLPAFLDGWLDAAPAGMTFVDGDEAAGYGAQRPEDFARAAAAIRERGPLLLAPENRAKFAAKVKVAHGLYLDAYANPRGSDYFIDPRGATPAEKLGENASAALRASDGWAWIYGESARWWPPRAGDAARPGWEEKLPGAEAALRAAKREGPPSRNRRKKNI